MNILITGANRGIGLEYVRQYLTRCERIFAACRTPTDAADLQALQDEQPDSLSIHALDVTDDASIDTAASEIEGLTDHIDLLINNAGVFLRRDERPGDLDRQVLQRTFDVNSIGPLMVAQRFLNLLRAADSPLIVNITSQLGSLARKRSGSYYAYNASKAALNMMSKALAYDLQSEGVTVVMMHPGWVQTDMGGSGATLTPERAVASMMGVIDGLSMADTARFLNYDGDDLPW